MTRPRFIILAVAAAGCFPSAGSAPASAPTGGGSILGSAPEEVFRVEELSPGVWAALVLPSPGAYAFANSLVVEGPEGVLVVDTQQSQTAARALIELIRARTDKPVRWVVNTHWHGDHVYGNQVYRETFPGVRFVGHQATRRDMVTAGRERHRAELAELPASIEARRAWLASGSGPDGATLTDEERRAVRTSLDLRVAYLADLRTLVFTPPDVTFSDRLSIHLGDRLVELWYLGAAHTEGDIVVSLPAEGVVAVGDLLEEGPLWLEGADIPGWAGALRRLLEMEPAVYLPSHGGVHRGGELLQLQADFLEAAVSAARSAIANGEDEDAAATTPALSPFREPFSRLGVAGLAFDQHAAQAVREAYRDLSGG